MKTYRPCAGAVVFNRAKKVLVCARADNKGLQWQFPQGGILKNEPKAQAAARELAEETSVSSVTCVMTSEMPLRYDFPPSVRKKMARCGIDTFGQEMYWSLFFFYGTDSEINLQTNTPEFKAWKWADISEAVDGIVYFKKDVYCQIAEVFEPIIRNYEPT